MKRTKREENSIIIYSIFFILLTIALIFLFISVIIPWIKEVNTYKKEVSELYDNYSRINKQWISFDEFNSNIKLVLANSKDNKVDSDYLLEVVESIDKNFYDKNFINNKKEKFNIFIEEISKKYSDSTSFDDKTKFISSILPLYSEDFSDLGDNSLTDFKFINYIESIAETFNIEFRDSIWISEIKLLEEYSSSIWNKSLDTNIFYIPLSLEINWSKSSIINFLYFIENVWKIKVDEESNIDLDYGNNKDFIEFKDKALKWQFKNQDYAIFNNQILDINYIKFDKYIDSSFNIPEWKTSFVNYLRSTQGFDKIKVEVSLRFYIKGVPLFKIEKQIKDFIVDFSKLRTEVQRLVSKSWSSASPRLLEINSTLNQMQSSVIWTIQKSVSTKTGVDEAYKQVIKYNKVLDEYKTFLKQINK